MNRVQDIDRTSFHAQAIVNFAQCQVNEENVFIWSIQSDSQDK